MKKLSLIIIFITCLCACSKGQTNQSIERQNQTISEDEGNEITEKLIYQMFFQKKDPQFYNEGMQQNLKRLGITGPCKYSIFSKDLLDLGKKCDKRYTHWQQENGEEYATIDFVNASENVLTSAFDTQDGPYEFNIKKFSINYKNDNEAYVEIIYDDSELINYYGEKPERMYENELDAQKGNSTIILIKEDGKWKVDNIIEKNSWGDDFDWKRDLNKFLKDPTEFMPYYGIY